MMTMVGLTLMDCGQCSDIWSRERVGWQHVSSIYSGSLRCSTISTIDNEYKYKYII